MKVLWIVLFNFFSCAVYLAQVYDLELLNKIYPDQPAIYTFKEDNCEITNDEKGFKIVRHVKEQFLILNDKGKGFNTNSVYTNSFIDIKNLKATNYALKGNKLERIRVDNVKVKDSQSDGNFYDDLKKITVTYPFTSPGSLIEIEYDEIYNEPRFYGVYNIMEAYPVLKVSYKIKYPNSVNLGINEFNLEKVALQKEEKNSKSERVLSWTIDSVKPIVMEDYGPSYKKLASYFIVSVKDYKTKNANVSLVGSVDNLFNWYLFLVKNLNQTPSDHLKNITDSLTKGCKTDIEKLERIYYWVQDKISYIAYEDGLGGYIPRESDIVCKRRYGDCKDMASLLTEMGKYANLPIYLTWIGTRDIPYQFSEVPVPMAANHMIATYLNKDTCLFLDATGKFQDLGVHTAFIQGKEAIIGLPDNQYIIKKVPTIPSSINYLKDSIKIKIDDRNNIIGEGYFEANGYFKVRLRNLLSGKSYKEQFDHIYDFIEKGNNKFKLDTFMILSNNRSNEFSFFYKFQIPNYVTEIKNESFININFDRNYMSNYSTKDRNSNLEFNCTFEKQLAVNLELLNGQTVQFMPTDILFNKDECKYSSTYSSKNNTVFYKSSVSVNKTIIEKDKFPIWSEFIGEINKSSNKSIVLNKTN